MLMTRGAWTSPERGSIYPNDMQEFFPPFQILKFILQLTFQETDSEKMVHAQICQNGFL